MSATLHELRQDLSDVRAIYGRGSSQAEQAFSRLVRTAAENGTPLDGLRHHTADEVERFFSWTIPGLDGHVYWDGAKGFTMNDGRGMVPRRWWFKHLYGTLEKGDDLIVECGEQNCINPEHLKKGRTRGYKLRWSEDRAIGAFQVVVMRLGYTPSIRQWQAGGYSPSSFTLDAKFGGWVGTCRAAGVALPRRTTSASITPESAISALRLARRTLRRWPTRDEFSALAETLHAEGLPSSPTTVRKVLGRRWKDCIAAAERGKEAA